MLTKENLITLTAQFKPDEHEILREMVYITEEAITRRLDDVDPSWQFERLEVWTSGDNVCASARLTVCGVSRDGIGMQKNGIGEPEKGAITDALKRCARLFGVGRYILDMGKIRDMKELTVWLNKSQFPSPQRPTTPPPAQNGANSPSSANPVWFDVAVGEAWKDIKDYLLNTKVYANEFEMKNSMAKRGVVADNKIAEEWKHKLASELVTFLKTRHEEKTDVPA